MVYAIDLFSTFPDELSTSARFDEIMPLQLIAKPGSTVATVSGELLLTEYDRLDIFEPIFEPIPLASPFGSLVPFSAELTIENSTWQLDTFEQAFAFNLTGQIDLTMLLGDVNCDGVVDLLDVTPFVDAISTGVFDSKADVNRDGVVDLLDVGPFVALLSGS